MTTLPQLIAQANSELKSLRSRCRIEQIGERLVLRGSFPPEPGDICRDRKRGRIFLGVTATAAGVRYAREKAIAITEEINSGKFERNKYRNSCARELTTTLEIIESFKAHKYAQGICDRTWEGDYADVLKHLKEVTGGEMLGLIRNTEADTRTRRRYAIALGALAKFAGIEVDLSQYKGNYSPSRVQPRNIPSDRQIVEAIASIKKPVWRWVYGILATYGIRPSELFTLDFDDLPILNITGGKTGARRVYPIYPEWFELFDLGAVRSLGFTKPNQVCRQFQARGIPFKPYDLRHAWAIRSMEFGLPLELAAQQMGHSYAVHSQTYHRWISDRHHQRAYDEAIAKRQYFS
jgi:integrase